MLTLQASQQGVEKIKDALKKAKEEKGWQRESFHWLVAASQLLGRDYEETGYLAEGISSKTWKNFLSGKAIRAKTFQTYCSVLHLNWKEVYDSIDFEALGLIVTSDYSLTSLLTKAQDMHRRGAISGAYEILRQIYVQINRYPEFSHLKTLGDYYLLFGRIQMQRGHLVDEDGAFSLAFRSLELFTKLNNCLKISESYQLIGICYLQIRNFKKSIESYKKGLSAIKGDEKFLYSEMRIAHDLAYSLLQLSSQENSKLSLEEASLLFEKSNIFFITEAPEFYKIAVIRTAEMYVKSGNHSSSQKILDGFEDVSNYSSMILPYQSLFLKINTERYFALNKIEEASKFFLSSLRLDQREGYIHQLQCLETIFKSHKEKFSDILPKDFNVYNSQL